MNILFGESRDQILTNDRIQGPALKRKLQLANELLINHDFTFVTSSDLLSHGGQESLGIEESGDPKHLRKVTWLNSTTCDYHKF